MKGGRDIRRSPGWRLPVGLLVSAILHGLLFFLLLRVEPPPPQAQRSREAVRLKVLDRVERARLDRERREAQEAREAVRDGQIVDIPAPVVEEVPEDARFLSRYNTRVEKEQRSRHRGRPKATGPGGSPGAPGDARADEAPVEERVMLPGPEADDAAQGAVEGPGRGKSGDKPRVDLAALGRMMAPTLGTGRGLGRRLGRGGGGMDGPHGSDDALLGVEDEGETTLVNSRSFRYWDFFQRVKEGVRGTWDPGPVYRGRDPTGKAYGAQDRLTVVSVVLDADGGIQRLEVVRESGLPFLDQEAMRAFRAAGPFPNPPSGLADDGGRIAFNFGFLLEVGSSRGQFFWQRR
jgi:TonB family protein